MLLLLWIILIDDLHHILAVQKVGEYLPKQLGWQSLEGSERVLWFGRVHTQSTDCGSGLVELRPFCAGLLHA